MLQQVVEWTLASHIVLHYESKKRQHRQSPCCKLFLFGFLGGSKVEWVEDAAGVAALVGRQAVALEDGVLVDAARVLDVLPPSDLYVVEQDELDDEQRGRGSKVLRLSGVVPLRNVDDSDLSENLRQQHPGDAQHRPPSVHQLRLHVPPQVLRVLRQSQRVKPIVSGKTAVEIRRRWQAGEPFTFLGFNLE
nr:hypothetical protein Iba_chr01fCG6120 [Ipomoea batatas]